MKRHSLSVLAIVAAVALALGTSMMPAPLNVKFTRSRDALIILNAEEVTLREAYVYVSDDLEKSNRWRAYIHELAPGESFRLSYEDLAGDGPKFDVERHSEASMYIETRGPEWLRGATVGAKVAAIPLEHQSQE